MAAMASGMFVALVIGCVTGVARAQNLAPVDWKQTVMEGKGLEEATAGAVSKFSVSLFDSEKKITQGPGNQVKVICQSPAAAPENFCEEGPPEYKDNGNGRWEVQFVVGSVYATFPNPASFKRNSSSQPLPDQYFYQQWPEDGPPKQEHFLRVFVGDPFTEVYRSPFVLKFFPDHHVSAQTSFVNTQPLPFVPQMAVVAATINMLKDRFGNVIRRPDVIDELEPEVELVEGWKIHPDVSRKPPNVTFVWIETNWYIDMVIVCPSIGNYTLQLGYRSDVDTLQYLQMKGRTDRNLYTKIWFTCEPGPIDTSQTYFESNWTAETRIGDVVSVDAQFFDGFGNAGYLVGFYLPFWLPPQREAVQSGKIVVKIVYSETEHVLSTELDGTTQGLVHTSFTVEEPGNATMVWSYESEPDAHYQLFFLPESPDPRYSYVDDRTMLSGGNLMVAGQSGGVLPVILESHKRENVPGNLDLFAGTIERIDDPGTSVGNVVFVQASGTGMYTARLDVVYDKAATYRIRITYDGELIQKGLQTVHVSHSPTVSAEKSDVRGIGIGVEVGAEDYLDVESFKQTAGRNLSIIVDAVDEYGNPHQDSSPMFELNAEFKDKCEDFEVWNGGGATRFYFSIEEVGTYYLEVFTAEGGSVYQANLEIKEAGVSHKACEITGFDDVVAGRQGEGYLEIRDTYRNMYKSYANTAQFEVAFRKDSFSPHTPSILGEIEGPEATDAGNRVKFNLTESGTYEVNAKWEDWPVQGSGQTIEVFPAAASGKMSELRLGAINAVAGVQIAAFLMGRDVFGNTVTALTFSGAVTARELGSSTLSTHFSFDTETSPTEPWKVNILLNFTQVGTYLVSVSLEGQEVQFSPAGPYQIRPAGFDPVKSQVTGPGLEVARVGEWNNIIVTPRDAYGNSLLPGALERQLSLSVQGAAAAQVSPFTEHSSTGEYTAAYSPSTDEMLLVVVAFQGGVLPGFPMRVQTSGASVVTERLSASDLTSFALANSEADAVGEEPAEAPVEPKETPVSRFPAPVVEEESPQKSLDVRQSDAFSADCPGGFTPNCGDHGYMLHCQCFCDPGWISSAAEEEQGGVKYCDVREEEGLSPAPAPALAPDSSVDYEDLNIIEDAISQPVVSIMAAGALFSFAAFLCVCLCCKRPSDDHSSDSDSETYDSKSPVLHGGFTALESGAEGWEDAHNIQSISAYFPQQYLCQGRADVANRANSFRDT